MTGRRRILSALLSLVLVGASAGQARAVVDEALGYALKEAVAYVKEGFSLREDNWQGKLSLGKKQAIKHQLYKGNEYWFWLGSPAPGLKLSVKVYDSKGRPVDVETKAGKHSASARVLAPKTGTYFIVIKAVAEDPQEKEKFEDGVIEWALVYGFR